MSQQAPIEQTVDHLFRHEAGKMVAVLVRLFGFTQVDVAQDIVQETLISALETWKLRGMPDQPRAWLYRVAKNKALNHLGRERHFNERITPHVVYQSETGADAGQLLDQIFLDDEIEDAQLRMMFACCHPSLNLDARLILILKTLCGLSVREIAAALISQEDAVAKRLYRAKEKIRAEGISLEVPTGPAIAERLDAVLLAIYLLFNEAYKSNSSDSVIRRDLCYDALRLGYLLVTRPLAIPGYDLPKINALMALMCFHTARFDARLDAEGQIVLLEKQDRSLWDGELTTRAYYFLKASASGEQVSTYHVEAAIASYHAQAKRFEDTNWQGIYYCYRLLYSLQPMPIVALNKAIARGYAEGAEAGLRDLLEIEGLDQNHLYHAALGDFYGRSGQRDKARSAYSVALKYTDLASERLVLQGKLDEV
jgi:RNA polymerase sigma factor (sigma-70 family)